MNWLKLFSIGLLFSYSSHSLAEKNYIVPSMVTIPAGIFTMGSNIGEPTKVPHFPEYIVKVDTFQLSQYEVTIKEFRKFVEATNYEASSECWTRKTGTRHVEFLPGSWKSPQNAPSDFHPVMCIGQKDAKAYITWLSHKTGTKYRLPSEAEWEYAARAGSKEDYFFGGDEKNLCEYANVFDESGARAFERDIGLDWTGVDCNDHAEYTSIVGVYQPNAFGLFDMIGNVGEYVEDCEHANYNGAPSDGSAWVTECGRQQFFFGMIRFDKKIIHRGGNYSSNGAWSRLFVRGHAGESNPSSLGEGFRLAQDIEEDTSILSAHRESTYIFLKELYRAQQQFRESLENSSK
ncbi:formylglycine-generating enzyme family protein [Cellvibrio polysaccharolyticus]|uniref:Formylglycine-generating enzyme family protein n=1 Tax=Cellvibrio polysaccharolyticus TaxID=2082724 RepID=A0A928YST5_9GAMM|nr:formylglycine-generating enzyme family protein [Cellvibrio polysaccharolyticus]MBE8716097.1 formylglycine-generating enzyme family protein [Cellvibrio polysaccharolyticus]